MPQYKEDINKIYVSERMQECLRYIGETPLTVVAAPMEYGKTTAIMWYLENCCSQTAQIARVNIYSDNIELFWQSFRFAFHNTSLGKQIEKLDFPIGRTAIGLFTVMVA